MKSAIKQVSRMREGGGAVLFPRPVAQSPSSPVVLTHTLNACPICSLWYGFFDYASLPCGHTYHPFCLWEHLRSSLECALPHCRETFKKESLAGIGIREVVAKPIVNDVDEPTVSTPPVATLPDVTSLSVAVEGSATASEVQRAVPVSSCNSEPIEKANHHLSQSSHTGAIPSNHGVTTSGVKCTVAERCFVCGTRDATVILKKCGHQELCFHCIEGRKRCPICDESIDGWELLRKESRVSTHLQSLGGASDILKDPLIVAAAGRKKAAKAAVVKASNVKAAAVKGPGDVVAEDAGLSTGACFSDSDDEGMGLQHWCGDEEFSEGGKRSMLPFCGQGDNLDETELVPTLHIEEDAVTEVVCSESHEDASEPERAVEKCMPKKTCKGRAGRSSYVQTLNHTRVIAKSMSDLLAIPPSASASRVENSATDPVLKGRRGRPAGGLKEAPSIPVEARGLQERVYSRVRTAPSRLTL